MTTKTIYTPWDSCNSFSDEHTPSLSLHNKIFSTHWSTNLFHVVRMK